MSDAAPADVDAALMARAQRGQRGAFDELVRRYVTSDADAADVVQQAFVRAYRALGRFRGDASVRSWLYRIGINVALNHVRDHRREQPSDTAGAELDVDATAPQAIHAEQRSRALRRAVEALPPKQRLVLELRVFDDLPFREVAELADCTENAAKVSFHYAVKRLRELLGEEGEP